MKNWNGIFLWVLIWGFFGSLCGTRKTKPFINEFFFKLSSEEHLPAVKKLAETLSFEWLRQVIPKLHLFRKTDIPTNNAKPEGEAKVTHWMNCFGNTLEYIEQDRYIQVYSSKEVEQSDLPFPGTQRLQTQFWSSHSHGSNTKPKHLRSCVVSTNKCTPIDIAVLDAFFDTEHENLHCNIVKKLAHNFVDGNNNPRPEEFPDDIFEEMHPEDYTIYSHGTMCMGRIASSAEHGCSMGGNNNASIVPLKFIDTYGYRRNKDEIAALEYMNNEIDIYSCSYGTAENIGFPATKMTHIEDALARGVSEGRNCKGSIYVFPSGNGNAGGNLDNCNTDLYANSVHTITIASISMAYELTEDTETCPCALVASFGSPAPQKELYMNTTIPKNKCTYSFKGSSAATAYAAGMISHALRENKDFSKRDIEHLLMQTAKKDMNPAIKWQTNGAGHKYNEKIGFGAIDLVALKTAAKRWKHVPEKRRCVVRAEDGLKEILRGKSNIKQYQIQSDACQNQTNYVKHLEHVQIEVEFSCSNISNIGINLISPMGTKVGLLTKITVRSDISVQYENFQWTFMAVLFWGEDPNGDWKLELLDSGTDVGKAEIHFKKLILHGTGHPSTGGQPLHCKDGTSPEGGLSTLVVVIIAIVSGICVIGLACGFYRICCRRDRLSSRKFDAGKASESTSKYNTVSQSLDI